MLYPASFKQQYPDTVGSSCIRTQKVRAAKQALKNEQLAIISSLQGET